MTKIMPHVVVFHKIGKITDNRVLYQIEQEGQTSEFTIPAEKNDSFESTKNELEESLKKSCSELNSKKAHRITFFSIFLGSVLGYYLAKNKKTLTKILSIVTTAISSCILGLGLFFKPTLIKFKDLTEKLEEYDIKEYKA